MRMQLLCLTIFVLLGACQQDEPQKPAAVDGNWTLDDARRFTEFDLYWLGEQYEGLAFATIFQYDWDDSVHFAYGEVGRDESGDWFAPLSVSIQPYCTETKERLGAFLEQFADVFGPAEDVEIRGAQGWLLDDGIGDSQMLYLWPGDLTIGIRIRDHNPPALEVGRDLFRLADQRATGSKAFPPAEALVCPPPEDILGL